MNENNPEQPVSQYPFTAEEITQANTGDHEGLANDYVDANGGYAISESDSEEGFQDSIVLSDQAEEHAKTVEQGVAAMYEDAYAEKAEREPDSEN
jgi:hypothetical protein